MSLKKFCLKYAGNDKKRLKSEKMINKILDILVEVQKHGKTYVGLKQISSHQICLFLNIELQNCKTYFKNVE